MINSSRTGQEKIKKTSSATSEVLSPAVNSSAGVIEYCECKFALLWEEKNVAVISMVTIAAIFSAGGIRVYAKILGPQTILKVKTELIDTKARNMNPISF